MESVTTGFISLKAGVLNNHEVTAVFNFVFVMERGRPARFIATGFSGVTPAFLPIVRT